MSGFAIPENVVEAAVAEHYGALWPHVGDKDEAREHFERVLQAALAGWGATVERTMAAVPTTRIVTAWTPRSGEAGAGVSAEARVEWWITDGPLDGMGGRPVSEKILGPFVSQDLAIKVRTYVEKVEGRERFWICPLELSA